MRDRAAELFVLALITAAVLVNIGIYCGPIVHDDAVTAGTLDPCAERDESANRRAARRAECDDSGDLPGRFVRSQGRSHTPDWPLDDARRVPFCDDDADPAVDRCYASNPPTSGLHLPVAREAVIDGEIIRLPPDPGIYDFEFPRETIPHLQEHAGVFVGYNCVSTTCFDAVEQLRGLVEDQLSQGARVIMAPDSELDDDTIALAAWTRIDVMPAPDYNNDRARAFIEAHSCRFDPEGFCGQAAPST
jgi:hypothetical protein